MTTEKIDYKKATVIAKRRFLERQEQRQKNWNVESQRVKPSSKKYLSCATQTITIMADIGNGPYAWIKDASDESRYIGPNIADAYSGFGGEPPVSEALEMDFRHWIIYFENNCDDPNFDWAEFNRQGEEMARCLYFELNCGYRIFYQKPSEDPGYENHRKIEILSDI